MAWIAVVVVIDVVVLQLLVVLEHFVTLLAVRVLTTVHPVHDETGPGWEVEAAIPAIVVCRGVGFVLTQGNAVTEVSVASVAVWHLET